MFVKSFMNISCSLYIPLISPVGYHSYPRFSCKCQNGTCLMAVFFCSFGGSLLFDFVFTNQLPYWYQDCSSRLLSNSVLRCMHIVCFYSRGVPYYSCCLIFLFLFFCHVELIIILHLGCKYMFHIWIFVFMVFDYLYCDA